LKTDSVHNAFTNKWIFRIETIIFFALTGFFAYPYSGYRSFFRQSLLPFSISITSVAYSQLRTITYVGTLGFGIFLILVFLTNMKNDKYSKEIAATNYAWLAFVLQASAGLSLQWTPYDVWITQSITLPVLFAITISLLVTSSLLLIKNKWTQKIGYFFSWGSLFFSLILLIIMLRFFSLFTAAFPTLTVIMIVNSSLAIFSLHNLNSIARKEQNIHNQRFRYNFKRFFPSKIIAVILLSILIFETISFVQPTNYALSSGSPTKNFYVGVTFGGNTTTEAKVLIDEVKNYTNVFVVDSLPISQNEAEMNEICDYAIQNGLHIIVYFAWFSEYWQANFLDTAKQRWGEKFLGIYLYDEPGGVQLDSNGIKYGRVGPTPTNQNQAASRYLRSFQTANRGKSDMQMLKMRNIETFTSDYALYWYDYKAGYDVVFAELGLSSLNNNKQLRQMTAEFVRGAATVQNKDWGAIITWTYNSAPYIEPGQDLYSDMMLAYNYGAKYVLVFDYPYDSNSTYGILKQEHLDALRNFWNYANSNPPASSSSIGRTAFVLPKDDGYGFRGLNDIFWGFWGSNASSTQLSTTLNNLMTQYGPNLDVIYNDGINFNTSAYNEFIFWNGTITKTLT
jgi:hypothetical protein